VEGSIRGCFGYICVPETAQVEPKRGQVYAPAVDARDVGADAVDQGRILAPISFKRERRVSV